MTHIDKLIARNRASRKGSFPYEDREWMRQRYEDRAMTLRQIAVEADCGLRTIARWMEVHRIPMRQAYYGARPKGPDSPTWKGGLPRCVDCGEQKSWHGAAGSRCMQCRSKSFQGRGNPNYRGIANVMTLVREWAAQNWRPLVFERDKFTCQSCNDKTGGNIHAHHIRPLSAIVREMAEALLPDLGTDEGRLAFITTILANDTVRSLKNGITLCEPCHAEEHKRLRCRYSLPRNYLAAS